MRHTVLAFPVNIKHDVFEFRKANRKNFSLGLFTAVLIHILFIGVYYFIETASPGVESKGKHSFVIEMGAPPSIQTPVVPPAVVLSPGSVMKSAIPVPVPDEKASNAPLPPTQGELSQYQTQPHDISGDATYVIPQNTGTGIQEEKIPDIHEFISYEKPPEIVVSVKPDYPGMALRSGLEGTVFVKVLIGKDGRPVKAVAVKFSSEIFVQPSVDAAMKFVFTPALQNKAPVMVWTTIPFKFKLNN